MVVVGLPDASPFEAGPLVMRRRRLAGSLIGGIRKPREHSRFLRRARRGRGGSKSSRFRKINDAMRRITQSDVRFRFVISLATLKGV